MALLHQLLGRRRRAFADGAVKHQFLGGDPGEALGVEHRQGSQYGAGDMLLLVFRGLAHIHQHRLLAVESAIDRFGIDLDGGKGRLGSHG